MRTFCWMLLLAITGWIAGVASAQSPDPFGGPDPTGNDPFAPRAVAKPPKADDKAAPVVKNKKPLAFPPTNETEARILSALDDETSVTFVDTPLSEAAQVLSAMHDIPILIDQRALEEIGLDPDTPIKISLRSVSLRSLLRLMLRGQDLTYTIRDEVLQITTRAMAESRLITRMYPFPAELTGKSEAIIKAMTATVSPQTWEALGGPSTAVTVDNILIVSATDPIHEEVRSFLEKLQEAFKKHKAGQ